MESRHPKVIGLQLDIAWEDKRATFDRVERMLGGLELPKGGLLVLPEMFSTGFSMNLATVAEGASPLGENFLAALAQRFGVWTLGGFATVGADGRGRNQAVVFGPGGQEIVRYDKIHPFSQGKEAEHFTGGDAVRVFEWKPDEKARGVRVAPIICYDLRFPELFRAAVRQGAEMFVVIANWPAVRQSHWTTLLQARAIENQAYVIGINRCGEDPHLTYAGGSMAIAPQGSVIAQAGTGPELIQATIDLHLLDNWRKEFPALRDMKMV